MVDMLSVSEARRRVLEYFAPVEVVSVPLGRAAGWVLAVEIHAPMDLPPFSNSSMDGFALRTADSQGATPEAPAILKVIADIPAGQTSQVQVGPGQAVRIMTGAPLPAGSDAVIPVEDTDFHHRQAGISAPPQVQLFRPVKVGENVRPHGQDVSQGDLVLRAGVRLRPQEIGFLAMLGIDQVEAYRLPRVAIFSSGDELLPAGAPLAPGKIYDANTYTLMALVARYGGEAVNLGIAADRESAVEACLEQAVAAGADLILSSAGVSVGAFDFVRSVVEKHGHLNFWRVNMRPGKPFTFGHYRQSPFIGLPGNPVSAFVGFMVFVRPVLEKLAGLARQEPPRRRVVLAEDIHSDGRESYLRAVIHQEDGRWIARLTGHQGSGNMRSLVQANALLLIPSGVKFLPVGSEVEAWLFNGEF